MAPQSRGVRTLLMSTLVLTAALSACDQPTEVEPALDPAFARTPAPVVTTEDCNLTAVGGGNKNVQVAVKLSNGNAAPGAIVTLVSKTAGPQCYAKASTPDGIVRFTKIAQGAQIFVTARDEVTLDVAKLEIIPPAIPNDLSIFDGVPSPARTSRQVPMLLSGTACTTPSPLSWTNWSAKYATPCVVGGPGLSVTVKFDADAPTTELTLLAPDGSALDDVIVAALSPWNFTSDGTQTRAEACAQAPWVDDCNNEYLSSGPALIQSVDLTDASGFVSLSHSHADTTAEPIVLEAIRSHDGLTFFGTITDGSGDVQMAPGMCTIATVEDVLDSSVPDVDIRYTQHSVGMTWPASTIPTPVNSALIVRAEVWATTAGGAGRYDLSWLVAGATASRSVRAAFAIPAPPAKVCSVEWSGNGTSQVNVQGYCAKSADQRGVPSDRTAWTLYFVMTLKNPPPPDVDDVFDDAFYTLTTVGDGVDPSKSTNTRAAISFNWDNPDTPFDDATLNRKSCPVPVNNDGRFGTFRLGSNDGRFGTF